MTLVRSGVAQGKRLLMDAALRLMAHSRSLSSLGLRELAREAGLNPNTFYRHFQSVDELGMALIRHIADQLRQPLRDLRREAAQRAAEGGEGGPRLLGVELGRGRLVCHETVALFFRFVGENPEAFIVGMRELHGASPLLRAELREVMEGFAQDMAEDIQNLQLVALDGEGVKRLSSLISRHLFQMSLDYLEQVDQRPRICAEAEEMIVTLFAGASVLRSLEQAPRA